MDSKRFGGYARKSKRVDWIQYGQLHAYWQASVGGKDPDRASRNYVKQRLHPPVDPFKQELRQWSGKSLDSLNVFFGLEGTGSLSNLAWRGQERCQEFKGWLTRRRKVEHLLGLNTQSND